MMYNIRMRTNWQIASLRNLLNQARKQENKVVKYFNKTKTTQNLISQASWQVGLEQNAYHGEEAKHASCERNETNTRRKKRRKVNVK